MSSGPMDFYARFGDLTDAEVLELLREGRERFRPEAWDAICAEARRRHIQLDDASASLEELEDELP